MEQLTQPKILFVDDDPANLDVMLSCWPYDSEEVLYANNGKTACSIAEAEHPSLIIMDWAMPIMNGLEAVQALQANPATKDIPVVMSTGIMTTSEDLKIALEAGAVDFLRKPFEVVEFQARVKAALRLNKSYQQVRELETKCLQSQETLATATQQVQELLGQLTGATREQAEALLGTLSQQPHTVDA